MQLLCLGANFRTAPLELRERLTYPPAALAAALARCGCGGADRPYGLSELAILSTCNRIELYAAAPVPAGGLDPAARQAIFEPLVAFLADTREMPAEDFAPALYRLTGAEVPAHLCRVAAGLDSMVLGEAQILGQVTHSFLEAQAQGAAGPVLSALFRAAIHAGKRARSETGISRNPATISSVAVHLAAGSVPDLASAQVAVLGAGEMAELAVEALRARGAARITVVNRTHSRAASLADRWGAQAATFEHLPEVLVQADIVISSTDAPHFLVSAELAAACLSQRPARPQVFIDIAVPRDIDPAVAALPGVRYYDLDDMQTDLSASLAERQQEVPRVEAIVAQEAGQFQAWLHSLEMAPLIVALRERADAIRRAEVEKTLRRLPQLSGAEREQVEALAEALVSKLLHEPTRRLKAEASNGNAVQYAAVARRLFGLND